ncbi:MAG: hypothetical protein OXU35_11215 [Acidobacteriota bacterium]|nr:hypothetical protein [Acidobacteriota bacterium]
MAAASSPDEIALKRGQLDAVIAGLLFMAGMRRSEVDRPPLERLSSRRPPATGC